MEIPHLWKPRTYQLPLSMAMPAARGRGGETKDRFVIVAHRRSGKDLTAIALTSREMVSRPGYYVHILPTLKQAKMILWDGKDDKQVPFLDRFPAALIKSKNETETQIVFRPLPGQPGYGEPDANGAIWQLRGADDPDSLRGPNYVGAIFSEYSEMDEYAWHIVQPVLEQNGGWAMFLFTPKGKNHSYRLYEMARSDPRWFCQRYTIDDTRRDAEGEDGSRVLTEDQMGQLRKEGTPEAIIQQEYYCSFEGYLHGTIYGDLVRQARLDKRISRVPWDSGRPVGTCWDIGRTDATAIWFYQRVGQNVCFIDYFEDSLKGADFYAKAMKEKPYILTRMILPWDSKSASFSAQKSPYEYFLSMFRGVQVADKLPVQMGIDMTRRMFSRFSFDEVRCAQGIEHLENYSRKWDDRLHAYAGEPLHDEHSHGSDALRVGVIGGLEQPLEFMEDMLAGNPTGQETDFAIFDEPRGMLQ